MSKDYYQGANKDEPNGKSVLQNFGRFKSDYGSNHVENVKKGDYKVPNKSENHMIHYEYTHHPELFNHTKLSKTEFG